MMLTSWYVLAIKIVQMDAVIITLDLLVFTVPDKAETQPFLLLSIDIFFNYSCSSRHRHTP
jgi:hypothetical protein